MEKRTQHGERKARRAPIYSGPERGTRQATDSVAHFACCRSCGQVYNARDLAQVFYHMNPDHQPRSSGG